MIKAIYAEIKRRFFTHRIDAWRDKVTQKKTKLDKMRTTLARKDTELAEKNAVIAVQKGQLKAADLRARLYKHEKSDLKKTIRRLRRMSKGDSSKSEGD